MTTLFYRHTGKTCTELDSVSKAKRSKLYPVSPKFKTRIYRYFYRLITQYYTPLIKQINLKQ